MKIYVDKLPQCCGECAFFGRTIDGERGACGIDGYKILQVTYAGDLSERLLSDRVLPACPLAKLPGDYGGSWKLRLCEWWPRMTTYSISKPDGTLLYSTKSYLKYLVAREVNSWRTWSGFVRQGVCTRREMLYCLFRRRGKKVQEIVDRIKEGRP